MFDKINHCAVHREKSITIEQFSDKYKQLGKPVVLSNLTKDWPATKKWDIDYLKKVAGDKVVPVYSSKPAKGYQHQHAAEMKLKLSDYLDMLKKGENDLRMFFYNILEQVPALMKDFSYPEIGLKFFKRLPVLFVGGRGAKVQMHYDIDLSNLLLCHFGGKKTVLLVSPEQTKYVYKVPFSFSALHSANLIDADFKRYPVLKNIQAEVAVLEHGDALFIPSGYWHYIIYDDIGFSMTLRSLPSKLTQRINLLKNIFITRTIDGIMRKLVGQRWNDRNEKLAIERTHQNLNLKP